MQALSSVEGGYDRLAPKFDHTPFRTSDGVLDATACALCPLGPFGRGLDVCCGAPRACGSSNPCARDRSRASTSARACSRRRAARTPAPGGYGPTSGRCPSPGPSTWRSASGRSGTSCPPNGLRCSPACAARCGPAGSSPSPQHAADRHLRPVSGTARVRPGQVRAAMCRVPVRHVLSHLPAACGPRRPDSSRIHRDDSPPDGSGPARGRQPATGFSSRADRARPAHAHAAGLHLIAVSVLPRRHAGQDRPAARSGTAGRAAAEHSDPDAPIILMRPHQRARSGSAGRTDRRLRNTRVDGVQPRNVMSARLEIQARS